MSAKRCGLIRDSSVWRWTWATLTALAWSSAGCSEGGHGAAASVSDRDGAAGASDAAARDGDDDGLSDAAVRGQQDGSAGRPADGVDAFRSDAAVPELDASAMRPDAMHEGEEISIEWVAKVGEAAFDCAQTYDHLGLYGHQVEPRDFRMYAHGLRLLTEDGLAETVTLEQDGAFQYRDVVLLDFEDASGGCRNGTINVHTRVRGWVKPGVYTGIAFELGVPETLSHENPTLMPSPLNLSGMHWSWNDGYKFARFDGMVKAKGTSPMLDSALLFHLGSTLCTGNAAAGTKVVCGRPNRPTIVLADFDTATQRIVVDYAALLAGLNLGVDQGGPPGCMCGFDDPECGPMLASVGLDYASGELLDTQSVFRVEPMP